MTCPCCGAIENKATIQEGRTIYYCGNNNCTRRTIPDQGYDDAFRKAKPFSLLSYDQGLTLWKLAKAIPAGTAMAELGVYKGGSAMIMRQANPDAPLYLFDTFTGHPDNDRSKDRPGTHPPGSLGDTSSAEVCKRIGGNPGDALTMCIAGYFPDSFPWGNPSLGLVHIDVDIYESVLAGLTHLAPLVAVGGSIVLDDWQTEDCPGVVVAHGDWWPEQPGNWQQEPTERGYQLILTRLR